MNIPRKKGVWQREGTTGCVINA